MRAVGTVLYRAAARLFPESGGDARAHHGVLPPLFLLLTFVAGCVDAVSFLGLGRLFVANMTGNVVFVGFAWAGAQTLSAENSLLALAGFTVGAWAGGRYAARVTDRLRILTTLTTIHALLTTSALVGALADAPHRLLIAFLAAGMGLQNTAVLVARVPDMTTTVVTRTLTGLAADPRGPAAIRRTASVATLLLGALTGAALTLHQHLAAALSPAVALLWLVAVVAARGPHPETR